MAVRKNQRLNEYGLFAGTDERPQDRGEAPLAAATEEEADQALGLSYVEPERREDRGELGDTGPIQADRARRHQEPSCTPTPPPRTAG